MGRDETEAFARLVEIVRRLRRECPWDRTQTPESIRHLTIEEAYELSDAILKACPESMREELGDLLLHVVFYAVMAQEKQWFTLTEVIETLVNKLVKRHPHVFGDTKADTPDQVKKNWENLKNKQVSSVLEGVPLSLPSLIRAYRIQERASHYGFDWGSAEEAFPKLAEELEELRQVIQAGMRTRAEEELGDFLFAVVNWARLAGLNPDDALQKSINKFVSRFQKIEQHARERGIDLKTMSLQEMNRIWEETKQQENRQ